MTDIFCKIVSNKEASYTVMRGRHTAAFLDKKPASTGHTLIVPKRHVTKIGELDSAEIAEIFRTAVRIAECLEKYFHYQGTTVLTNSGADLQDIPHLHVHVYGQTKDEATLSLPCDTSLASIRDHMIVSFSRST